MSDQQETYPLHPIGYVRQSDIGCCIELLEAYRLGLKDLDRFSHVHVLWWFHEHDSAQDRAQMQQELPYAPGTVAGVFAGRSNFRPNPIGMTTTFVLDVNEAEGTLIVAWMDAHDGTPIIDLKPFIPVSDRPRDVSVASWFAAFPQWMEDAADFDWAAAGLGEE